MIHLFYHLNQIWLAIDKLKLNNDKLDQIFAGGIVNNLTKSEMIISPLEIIIVHVFVLLHLLVI